MSNKLLHEATKRDALRRAWSIIRANGIRSPLPETRLAVERFEQEVDRNISRIQRWLRDGSFSFAPQKGVAKRKPNGSARGIVMAPITNRIVERAWLDALQLRVPFVQEVVATPTSVGGVPERSVPHGLALITQAMNQGQEYFVRADISGFFDHIPRQQVLDRLSEHIDDDRFLRVLDAATRVTLDNEDSLGEDRNLFPTDQSGVAQGSPLSPLFGNILLHDFDVRFNDRGVLCVRFIDDFVLLGPSQPAVRGAFRNARKHLEGLGLHCHDPYSTDTPREKAQTGHVGDGFVFLGYDIRPGLLQPSKKARKSLLKKVDRHIQQGRRNISDVIMEADSFAGRQRYAQTLDLLDRVLRGWGDAFAYSNATDTIDTVDQQIDDKIANFRAWYRRRMEGADWRTKRRTAGVCLLSDIERKSLDELPFRLSKGKKRRATSGMILISTDGSVETGGCQGRHNRGVGGWSAVFHADGRELSGGAEDATNNEMELTAVIRALENTPIGSRVRIRTDSQYVYRAVQEGTIVRSNRALWEEYLRLAEPRRVDIMWVKGHAGDEHNERADVLAREEVARRSGSDNDAPT